MDEEVIFRIEVPGGEQAVNTLENLTKANKALREERKKLDLDSVQGKQRVKEINAELDKNTEAIKENSSALEKQRLNIGNYKSALDNVIPGLGGFVSGIQGMTKASLAFIATPLGAIIAAIGVAMAGLTEYFRGSEEGQNNLNKIVLVGKSIFEQFKNVLEFVGKTLFEAFSNPKQAIIDFANLVKENIINRFEGFLELIPQIGKAIGLLFEGKFVEAGKTAFDAVAKVTTGIENASSKIEGLINDTIAAVNAGIDAGKKLADLQAKIDRDERALITERARVSLEVSKLRAQAIKEEGDVKKATVEQAIKLEEQLSDKEVALAKIRLANAKLLLETNGDDKEALNEVAKATAAVLAAEESRFSATLRFQKELEKLRDEEKAEQERIEKEQEKNNEEVRERLKKEREEQAEIEAEQAENNRKVREANAKKAAEKEVEIEKIKAGAITKLIGKVTGDRIDAQKLYTNIFKKGALGEAYANTKAAAIAAYKALAGIPIVGPVLGAIAAASAIAFGTSQYLGIQGVTFARGGIAQTGGMLQGRSHAQGGIPFSVGGRLGFEAEGGEAIINKRSSKMFRSQLSAINQAGGGRAFATGGEVPVFSTANIARASESTAVQRELFESISRLRPVVTVEDINKGQGDVDVVESRAQIL
jgi:hypothetical protein